MQAFRKITLADLEARPGWNTPGEQPPSNPAPRAPRNPHGHCKACGKFSRHRFVRKVFSTGTGFHVMAVCAACGCNARGAGQWVGRDEVAILGWILEDLPESSAAAGQGVLL